MNIIEFDDFKKLDIRVGTIIDACINEKAIKKSYKLTIDFGLLGIKVSSAQITDLYNITDLIGMQILAVVNFKSKQVAGVMSEVLVLGIYDEDGVILIKPDKKTNNGNKLG